MRTVVITRDRLPRWLDGFAERHGPARFTAPPRGPVIAAAPDGAVAEIMINSGPVAPGDQPGSLLAQACADRTIGVILARKGGHSVGVFAGDRLLRHATGASYVQSRTKAGGWSQQRYSRRRDNQATRAYGKAADDVDRVLTDQLDRVVCGGDRIAIETVLDDSRLTRLVPLWDGRLFGVAEPRLAVLQAFGSVALGVTIRLNDLC